MTRTGVRTRRVSTPLTPLHLAQSCQLSERLSAIGCQPSAKQYAARCQRTLSFRWSSAPVPSAGSSMRSALKGAVRIIRVSGGEKGCTQRVDAARFNSRPRQSLGLSVITIEGSTTKKCVAPRRLWRRTVRRYFAEVALPYNGVGKCMKSSVFNTLSVNRCACGAPLARIKKRFHLTLAE